MPIRRPWSKILGPRTLDSTTLVASNTEETWAWKMQVRR
jgi:hypothetical protein